MSELARIGLGDGGWLLVESDGDGSAGPVKAGRVPGAVPDWPDNLRSALRPMVQASRDVLDSLRDIDPDDVKVEFGVKLTAGFGAVLAKGQAGCHLVVTLAWSREDGESPKP